MALCAATLAGRLPAQEKGPPANSANRGEGIFAGSCAGCHGLDARGGERAPAIAGGSRVQHMSDAEISAVIANGIPGTGMPPFHSLNPEELLSVVAYLRTLQGQKAAQKLPGDATRGKAIFVGKGECSSCHMMRGEGGFLGPDLTTFGATRSAKDISDVLTNPDRVPDPAYRMAVATLRNGLKLTGVVRNEDNFSIQLQTTDGSFHSLSRSALQNLEYQAKPAMPNNYRQRLDASELDDLVSYLMSVGHRASPDSASKDEDLREEDFRD
jgi:cytochrome c oxidase cbb3-type subunit 3